MMRLFSALLIAFGLCIMAYAVTRFFRLYTRIREETYASQQFNQVTNLAALLLMCFFIVGYGVGLVHVITTDVEPIFGFVSVVFFLGGVYIWFAVEAQIQTHASLREKAMEVMRTFVSIIDMKDSFTQGHSRQVYNLVALFYDTLEPALRASINKSKLLDAAMLHDIGKISIQDGVLNKSGPLAPREWDQIKMHPANGQRMLEDTVFRDIGPWVLYHHERMDGKGYYNIPGDSIPMESRIIAIADTYCALCTDRIYRPRRPHTAAADIMTATAGEQLDGPLLGVFLSIDPAQLGEALNRA